MLMTNRANQYHFFENLWPELEVNYEYWPNGEHQGLNRDMLTPSLIVGRVSLGLTPRTNFITGTGYQSSVTNHPVTNNSLVVSARMTF
jgi:hypothetical protein